MKMAIICRLCGTELTPCDPAGAICHRCILTPDREDINTRRGQKENTTVPADEYFTREVEITIGGEFIMDVRDKGQLLALHTVQPSERETVVMFFRKLP